MKVQAMAVYKSPGRAHREETYCFYYRECLLPCSPRNTNESSGESEVGLGLTYILKETEVFGKNTEQLYKKIYFLKMKSISP